MINDTRTAHTQFARTVARFGFTQVGTDDTKGTSVYSRCSPLLMPYAETLTNHCKGRESQRVELKLQVPPEAAIAILRFVAEHCERKE